MRRRSANPSRAETYNTRALTHAARGTRYRKAEIDNTGGPPAPYLNLDTRPAVAPGPSRRDGALSSSCLPFGFCADSAGADATNKSCIMDARAHTCAFDRARITFWTVDDARRRSFSRTIVRCSQGIRWKKSVIFSINSSHNEGANISFI